MDYYWIDTHAHIFGEEDDIDQIKENALNHNVKKVCAILGSLDEVERAYMYAKDDPFFDFAIGVHPGSVRDISEHEFEEMMSYLLWDQVKFVGEIGLDYYWDTSFNELQKDCFIRQIELANEYNLPIAIHMRESSDDVYNILKKHPVKRKGIVHCFTEGYDSAKKFEDLGFYLSIGGIATFKNGDNVRELIDNVSEDYLLTETDSPYLTPHPFRGKKNEPAYVSYVGKEIARIKGVEDVIIQKLIINNYNRLILQDKK